MAKHYYPLLIAGSIAVLACAPHFSEENGSSDSGHARKPVVSQFQPENGLARPSNGMARFVDPLPIPPVIKVQRSKGPQDVYVRLDATQTRFHRDLPETTVWGYNESSPGPTIEVESGQLVRVHWQNRLPPKHFLAEPKGMMMGDKPLPEVRAVTHLHGAVVAQPSITDKLHDNDGWPDLWTVPGEEQIAEYPNPQSARMLWYHDHSIAETGRNVAAGLAGMYLIRDSYERSLNLPSGAYEVPLLIQSHGISADGSLYYTPSLAQEFYGNTVTINGKLWPYLNVEPRKYRFRILNGSNARSYALKLLDLADTHTPGPAMVQIGTDSGFLENAAVLDDPMDPNAPRLKLAPAERADVIIDFSAYAGRKLLLHNSDTGESGDGELKAPQLMAFNVGTAVTSADTSALPMKMRPIRRMETQEAVTTRKIVINSVDMADGTPMLLLNNKGWMAPIEERPVMNTTEVWEIINTEPDTHPFHVHLVEFQVLDRTSFDVEEYKKSSSVRLTGTAEQPDANELGWKDTVRVPPGKITRIIMKFAPYTGFYVYHCHILEHEDMDMMRPFEVVSP